MVISDLNIICLNQTDPIFVHKNGIGVDILSSHCGYGKHWKTLRDSKGIWYQLYPIERMLQAKYNNEFFDLNVCKTDYQAIAYDNYRAALIEIIEEYLTLSPVHEILLLIRIDEYGESRKTVKVRREDFETDFEAGKIHFNTIYHIVK